MRLIKKFDFVFHFAALINNEESLKYPKRYFKNNYEKGKIFLQGCIENNLTNIIYSSTAAVYGNRLKKVDENDLLNPISPYSRSKLKLENFQIHVPRSICVSLPISKGGVPRG